VGTLRCAAQMTSEALKRPICFMETKRPSLPSDMQSSRRVMRKDGENLGGNPV